MCGGSGGGALCAVLFLPPRSPPRPCGANLSDFCAIATTFRHDWTEQDEYGDQSTTMKAKLSQQTKEKGV